MADSVAEKLALAKQLHAVGRFYEVEQIYKTILAVSPNHLQTFNLLGQLYTAIDIYRRAIKAAPANSYGTAGHGTVEGFCIGHPEAGPKL